MTSEKSGKCSKSLSALENSEIGYYNGEEGNIEGSLKLSKRLIYNIPVSREVANSVRTFKSIYSKEIGIVVMNMLSCVKSDKILLYSRDATAKTKVTRYNKKGISNNKIIKSVDLLASLDYVVDVKASKKQNPTKERKSSYMKPTQKFIERFCTKEEAIDLAEIVHSTSQEVIILKDVNGEIIDYEDSAKSVEARSIVESLNAMNRKHLFTAKGKEVLDEAYVRIFHKGSPELDSGGRFYRGDTQNLKNSGYERLWIQIDGEQTVEVDFMNLHIRMLCDIRGIDGMDMDSDIYMMPLADTEQTDDNRWLIKQAVNIMFNCESDRRAYGAIQSIINTAKDREFSFNTGTQVVRAIRSAFPWLANDFCQKNVIGHTLMNLDSWIAHEVVKVFVADSQPIAIVHDSFLVQMKNKDKLVVAMTEAYCKITKTTNSVPLSAKWIYFGDVVKETIISSVRI